MEKVIYQAYPHFYDRMQQFVKENESVKKCDVCFVGDSMIELLPIDSFDFKCVNRGIISDKSAGVLMTLNDRVIATNPKEVFLFVGSNDLCDGYTLKQIENNLKDIVTLLQENLKGVKIFISIILPPCYYEASHVDKIYRECRDILKLKALNDIIKNMEDIKNNIHIFDIYPLFADENDSLRVDDTVDGIHLNKDAYLKLVKELKKVL